MIYIIRSGTSEFVKIGYAINVAARINMLQCSNPETLHIIRTMEGDRDLEGWLHRQFRHLRHRSEWFTFDPEMLVIQRPEDEEKEVFKLEDKPPVVFLGGLISPDQIEAAARGRGMTVKELCRKSAVHPATFYRWKADTTSINVGAYARLVDVAGADLPSGGEAPSPGSLSDGGPHAQG